MNDVGGDGGCEFAARKRAAERVRRDGDGVVRVRSHAHTVTNGFTVFNIARRRGTDSQHAFERSRHATALR